MDITIFLPNQQIISWIDAAFMAIREYHVLYVTPQNWDLMVYRATHWENCYPNLPELSLSWWEAQNYDLQVLTEMVLAAQARILEWEVENGVTIPPPNPVSVLLPDAVSFSISEDNLLAIREARGLLVTPQTWGNQVVECLDWRNGRPDALIEGELLADKSITLLMINAVENLIIAESVTNPIVKSAYEKAKKLSKSTDDTFDKSLPFILLAGGLIGGIALLGIVIKKKLK